MEVLDLGFVEKEDWGQEKEYTPLTPKNLFGLLATILVNPWCFRTWTDRVRCEHHDSQMELNGCHMTYDKRYFFLLFTKLLFDCWARPRVLLEHNDGPP